MTAARRTHLIRRRPVVVQPAPREWGNANPRRGLVHDGSSMTTFVDHAKALVAQFPVGSIIGKETLDNWMAARGLLRLPPVDAPKNSDAWLGHLQRRYQIRSKINNAAMHPRMLNEGSTPFRIDPVGEAWHIRAPHVAAERHGTAAKVASLATTKRKQLGYLMQSADWAALPPYERAIAQEIFVDISNFEEDVRTGASRIQNRLDRLSHRIEELIASGEVQPRDRGIQQLIAPRQEELDLYGDEEEIFDALMEGDGEEATERATAV